MPNTITMCREGADRRTKGPHPSFPPPSCYRSYGSIAIIIIIILLLIIVNIAIIIIKNTSSP